MTISELITELEKFKEVHGDVMVTTKEEGFGGYAVNRTYGISEDTIYAYDVEAESPRLTKELFPEWDETDDGLDLLEPLKVVNIKSGQRLYAV